MTAKKVLVSLSNFKGTLTNAEATRAVATALSELGIAATEMPVGDGGAGTALAVHGKFGGGWKEVETFRYSSKPEPLKAKILLLGDLNNPESIYLESSQVCGGMRDALGANSRGLGELIDHVLQRWPALPNLYIGLGDSSISEMGMGALAAIGFRFLDAEGNDLEARADHLVRVHSIEKPRREFKVPITVLCDVQNPVCGPHGSARIFAPQKGATPEQVSIIEAGMENLAAIIGEEFGRNVRTMPMSGSAGGLSAGLHGVLGAKLVSGARFLLDWIDFDDILAQHDSLFVGEGRTDRQSLSGKAPYELIARAKRLNKPVIITSGSLGDGYEELLKKGAAIGAFAAGADPDPTTALKKIAQQAARRFIQGS